jgi:flavin-binding protein dodecin
MANSVYRVTEIVGTSTRSWEDATKVAVQTAAKSLRDLRVAEVSELDVTIENGKIKAYRAKLKVSFKFEGLAPPAAKAAAATSAAAKGVSKKKTSKKKSRR